MLSRQLRRGRRRGRLLRRRLGVHQPTSCSLRCFVSRMHAPSTVCRPSRTEETRTVGSLPVNLAEGAGDGGRGGGTREVAEVQTERVFRENSPAPTLTQCL